MNVFDGLKVLGRSMRPDNQAIRISLVNVESQTPKSIECFGTLNDFLRKWVEYFLSGTRHFLDFIKVSEIESCSIPSPFERNFESGGKSRKYHVSTLIMVSVWVAFFSQEFHTFGVEVTVSSHGEESP